MKKREGCQPEMNQESGGRIKRDPQGIPACDSQRQKENQIDQRNNRNRRKIKYRELKGRR